MKRDRWIFATVIGVGDLCFQCDNPSADTIEVRCACRIAIGRTPKGINVDVSKLAGYELGLFGDPLSIPRSSIALMSVATSKLSESAEAAWRTVQPAPPGAMHRLKGRNSR